MIFHAELNRQVLQLTLNNLLLIETIGVHNTPTQTPPQKQKNKKQKKTKNNKKKTTKNKNQPSICILI